MCNLSEVLLEKGIEKGIEKGKIIARYEDGMSVEDIAVKMKVKVDMVKYVLIEEGLIKI